MFWFILAIIIAIAGVVCLIATPAFKTRSLGVAAGVGCLILALLLWFVSGLKSVPTKSIGVPVSFGKVTGAPYGPGIHPTWQPWKHLAIIDETIQTTTFEVDPKTGQGGLDVRIGGQQTAKLDITIQWRVLDSSADELFQNYANKGPLMGEIQNAVVVRELKQVANQVMGDYNPIQDVAANTTAGNSQFSTFGPKILAQMRQDIGNRVQVLNLLLPLAHYDDSTQQRLNQIQQQYAETAIAKQQIQTNIAQNQANQKISSSVSHDPGVLVHECLQLVASAEKTGYQLPTGFQCMTQGTTAVLAGK